MPLYKDSAFPNTVVLPKARVKDIVVQEIEDEILVYDFITEKANHLNKISSTVWKRCDGKTTLSEIVEVLSRQLKHEIEEDFVWIALDELDKVSLFEDGLNKNDFVSLSRRNVLMRYALTAVLLPSVVSLIAPQAVSAQSCLGSGQTDCCVTPCCPGFTCQNAFGIACPGVCVPTI